MKQKQALYEILTFSSRRDLGISIYQCDADDGFHFLLTKNIILLVLVKCIKNEISVYDLEDWASFIECRDEILSDQYEDYIYALSNPALMNDNDMRDKKVMLMTEHDTDKIKNMLDCLTLQN